VYVKIFKKGQSTNVQQNGFDIVDQFFAKKNINLIAKERQNFTFKYNIPAFAQSGDYQVATYFVSQYKLNLFSLSFTDDVVGSSRDFTVSGEASAGVFIDKQHVTIGTSTFLFAAFIPKVSKNVSVPISFDLQNTTSKPQSVKVTYKLYSWDGLLDSNIITTKTDSVSLSAKSPKRLTYTVTDTEHPVYYLVIEADYNDTKSIINVRFVREDVDVPRINFSAVTRYPLEAKTNNIVFACVHNSGLSSSVSDNKLIVSVEDSLGNIVSKAVYNGVITGNMMGFKTSFVPLISNGDLIVKADLYHKNQLVDSVSMKYDCANFSTSTCKTSYPNAQNIPSNDIFSTIILIVLVVLFLIFLIIVRKVVALRNSPDKNKWAIIGGILVVLIILFAWLRFSLFMVQAALDTEVTSAPTLITYPLGVTANISFDPNIRLYAYGDLGFSPDICDYGPPICKNCQIPFDDIFHIKKAYACTSTGQSMGSIIMDNQNISVAYGVVIKDVTDPLNPQVLSNNDTVEVGDKIQIEHQPFANNNISWFIAGSTTDSPYGYWGALPSGCNASDHIASDVWVDYTNIGKDMDFYLPMSIDYPDMNVVPISANLYPQTNDTFVITASGSVEFRVDFLPTSVTEALRYTKDGLDCRDFKSYAFPSVVPQKTVAVNLIAVLVPTSNQAPNSPNIVSSDTQCGSGPTWTSTVVYSATDPDGDELEYGIMMSDDGGTTWSSEVTVPGSGTLTSGSQQTFTKTWTSAGAKKIKIRAIDIYHESSLSTIADTVAQTCSSLSYTITSSAGTGGLISPLGVVRVNSGDDQTFTSTPNSGYQISSMTVDSFPATPVGSYTFSDVTSNHTINVSFASVGLRLIIAPLNTSSLPTDYNDSDHTYEVLQVRSGEQFKLKWNIDPDADYDSCDYFAPTGFSWSGSGTNSGGPITMNTQGINSGLHRFLLTCSEAGGLNEKTSGVSLKIVNSSIEEI